MPHSSCQKCIYKRRDSSPSALTDRRRERAPPKKDDKMRERKRPWDRNIHKDGTRSCLRGFLLSGSFSISSCPWLRQTRSFEAEVLVSLFRGELMATEHEDDVVPWCGFMGSGKSPEILINTWSWYLILEAITGTVRNCCENNSFPRISFSATK